MKVKPLYMYGTIFVLLVLAIVFTSSNTNQSLNVSPNSASESGIPNDDVHNGITGMTEGTPSKSNVREDFWIKLESTKSEYENNPNDTLAMKNYAEMLAMSHQAEKAIELYEKILAVDSNRIDILLAEALAYFNEKNYAMAEVVTKKIISNDANNLEAKYNLAVISAAQGKIDEAKKIWKELSEKNPDSEIGKLAAKSLEQISK